MHNKVFPNESVEYREARNRLLGFEIELRAQVEKLGQLRKDLPLGGALKSDYEFGCLTSSGEVGSTKFSSLFEEGKDTLVVYSFMYGPDMEKACPACTSLLDGLNGSAAHIKDRVNLAVVAKSSIERICDFAGARNWDQLEMLSSQDNTYNADYFAENDNGNQIPALNVFKKTEEGIFHFYNAELLYADIKGHPRHVDSLWPVWNLLDMTPDGRGESWFPKLEY